MNRLRMIGRRTTTKSSQQSEARFYDASAEPSEEVGGVVHSSAPRGSTTTRRSRLHGGDSRSSSFGLLPVLLAAVIIAATLYTYLELVRDRLDASLGYFSKPWTAVQVLSQSIDLSKCTVHTMLDDHGHSSSTTLASGPNTVVTAYFRVKSKYDATKYDAWMSNMLSIQDPIVVFTQSDMVDKVKQFRQHAKNRTVIVESRYQDLPLSLLGSDFWQHQLDIDPEKRIHQSYELFWIWLSKSWWTVQAIQLNYFHSTFYMWSDIGCFRNRAMNDKLILQHPTVVPGGTLLWMAHHTPNPPSTPIWNDKYRNKPNFYHSGSQGAGTSTAWIEYHTRFAETLDAFVQRDMFVGEDQCVLQSTCLLHPHLCAYVPFDQVNDNHYFGLRYVLHYGMSSAKNTPNQQYQLWRPPGWNVTTTSTVTVNDRGVA